MHQTITHILNPYNLKKNIAVIYGFLYWHIVYYYILLSNIYIYCFLIIIVPFHV